MEKRGSQKVPTWLSYNGKKVNVPKTVRDVAQDEVREMHLGQIAVNIWIFLEAMEAK